MHDDFADELSAARKVLSNACDWLNSDWRPLRSPLTNQAAEARITVQHTIGELKGAIDRAKDVLAGAFDETDE